MRAGGTTNTAAWIDFPSVAFASFFEFAMAAEYHEVFWRRHRFSG
jgi:hypothetical protein